MKILGIIFSVIFIIALAVYFTVEDSQRIKKLHIEYKSVSSADELNGKVQNLYTEKGACFVTLLGEKKISIAPSGNYAYKEVYLSRVISIGDKIIKEQESDTLIVFKKESEYKFVIGKIINK